ncbi:AAA family ATPase [Nannocystaceae bacterium ST9]
MARFLESITLTNFLSFGPEGTTLALEDVNVLVGANGSGKSNLIEAINVLRHAPRDIMQPLREGGGIREYLWRPQAGGGTSATASLELAVNAPFAGAQKARYGIEFAPVQGGAPVVLEEWLFPEQETLAFFRAVRGSMYRNVPIDVPGHSLGSHGASEQIDIMSSVLAQVKDPRGFREATKFAENLDASRMYRQWIVGPTCPLRIARRPDLPTSSLLENFENFPARLATLKSIPAVKRRLLELIKDVSPGFDDIEVVPEGGALQVYLIEGDRKISSYRLSDGTLRYLMLLTIFLDPTPPPLIVIEEPEISLHPDVLPSLRDLILEASARTQIIITTQSPTFLDAWTDHPSAVVVCEREGDSTTLERLVPEKLLDGDDGLGVRWNRGEIGGNRW